MRNPGTKMFDPEFYENEKSNRGPNKLILAMLVLLGIVVLTVFILLIIILVWLAQDKFDVVPPEMPTGNTSGWRAVAQQVLLSIDETVNPCDDFFKFTCGNWMRNNPIPIGEYSNDNFQSMQNDVALQLGSVLSGSLKGYPDAISKAAGPIYNQCVKFQGKDGVTTEKLLGLVKSYGGWPVIDPKWDEKNFDPYLLMGHMSSVFQIDTFFKPVVDVDWKNPSGKKLLYLYQGTMGLAPAYYSDSYKNIQDEYTNMMFNAAIVLSNMTGTYCKMNEKFQSVFPEIVKFEAGIAGLLSVKSNDYESIYIETTLTDLKQDYRTIGWESFLTGLLSPHIQTMELDAKIIIPAMLENPQTGVPYLNALVNHVSQVSKSFLANYFIWRLLYKLSPQFLSITQHDIPIHCNKGKTVLLPQFFPPVMPQDSTNRSNAAVINEREVYCVDLLIKYMPFAMARLYLDTDKDFRDNEEHMELIKNQLSGAYQTMLTGVPWMDTYSKLQANDKFVEMTSNMGYPSWINNDTAINSFYTDLIKNITRYESDLSWYLFYHELVANYGKQYWTQLLENGNKTEFKYSPALVNAWYRHPLNALSISAALMRHPLYDKTYPQAWNYASIGFTIGRAMADAFDFTGIQFGPDGKLSKWLSDASLEKFENLIPCIADQYHSFCYPFSSGLDICIEGNLTLDNNMADNAGIKAAWLAYKTYQFTHGIEARLPGYAKYDMDQVFFIGYGHMLCQNITEPALEDVLLTQNKSPYRDRVIGSLQNFYAFSETFNCKPGDKMYHDDNTCTIW